MRFTSSQNDCMMHIYIMQNVATVGSQVDRNWAEQKMKELENLVNMYRGEGRLVRSGAVMVIEQPAIWLRWIYPRATWRMDKREKAVYLTFDDGPIPEATPFILATLAEFGIHATFFMVGDNVRKYPELYRQVVEADTA